MNFNIKKNLMSITLGIALTGTVAAIGITSSMNSANQNTIDSNTSVQSLNSENSTNSANDSDVLKIEQAVNNGLSKINQATNQGIQQIQSTAKQATYANSISENISVSQSTHNQPIIKSSQPVIIGSESKLITISVPDPNNIGWHLISKSCTNFKCTYFATGNQYSGVLMNGITDMENFTKIRLYQNGLKYFIVASGWDKAAPNNAYIIGRVVYLYGNSNNILTDEEITNVYCSNETTPVGFPQSLSLFPSSTPSN